MNRYELVVFDFDGTLADSAQWMHGVVNQMADKHHFRPVADHEIEALRGMSTRAILAQLRIEAWRLPFIARDIRRLAAASASQIPLFAGIEAMLLQLAERGVALAVLTSNGESTVRTVLGARAALVRRYACGASLFGKAPKLARLVKELAVPRERVLCIGDETRDIEAAQKVGLAVAAVTWGYANETILRSARPDYVLQRVEDIVPLCVDRSRRVVLG